MKIIIKSLIAVMATVSLSACNLDLTPSGALTEKDAFRTMSDAENFSRGMAVYFKNSLYGRSSHLVEFQTDLFNATLESGNNYGSVHRMDNTFNSSEQPIEREWEIKYSSVLEINTFLKNIGNIKPNGAVEEKRHKEMTAYAHYYRAHIYYFLVSAFADAYNPATASTDLGVPLELVPDKNAKPSRATAEAVYTQILKDISDAKDLFAVSSSNDGLINAIYPTLDATKALEMKVKFAMGNYVEAAAIAEELIASGRYSLARSEADMQNEWVNDNGPETIMQMFTSNLTLEANSTNNNGSFYLNYSTSIEKYRPLFIPTQAIVDKYEPNDFRFKLWFKEFPCRINAKDIDLILFDKYAGNPSMPASAGRNYMHKPKVHRLGEAYLIAAESYMMQPTPNPGQALTKMNDLLGARNATLLTSVTMEDIQTEWAKETIGEGVRLNCWKRWGRDVPNGGTVNSSWAYSRAAQNSSLILTGDNYDKKKYFAQSYFYTWPIPADDRITNPNLVQNPGWEDN